MDSDNNIYTVLLVIAALALVAAIGYVAMKSMSLFGSPFSLPTAMIDHARDVFACLLLG